jgi:hypothetical protein
LFVGIIEKFIRFTYGFLPFPAEVGNLITGLEELLGGEHTAGLEIFIGGGEFGVYEIF